VAGTDWLLIGGALLFVAGAVVVRAGMVQGSGPLMMAGVAGLAGAVLSLGVGAWRLRRRVDWRRVEAEQRLWESGPLGRAWLRIRQAILGR
jgi:hypothetical protein